MKPKQGKHYFCKKCGLIEFIPEIQDGVKVEQITAVYCSICKSKRKSHKYKMYEVKDICH